MSADGVHVERLSDHLDAGHGTRRGYLTGFALSVVLTAIPFWLVMGHAIGDSRVLALVIMGFAVVQIIVHMIYFLHMNTRSEGGWTVLALIFTIVLVVITLSGSTWVMDHMNANMMPAMPTMPGMAPAGGAASSPLPMERMPTNMPMGERPGSAMTESGAGASAGAQQAPHGMPGMR